MFQLTPLTADVLAEGIHCTVKYEGKIYRAILNDVSDKDAVNAVLPDYGNSITTSLDNVCIMCMYVYICSTTLDRHSIYKTSAEVCIPS